MMIKNKNAMVLLLSYLAIASLTIMASSFIVASTTESRASLAHVKSLKAFWLAEAGVQRALWELNTNNLSGTSACGSNRCIAGTLSPNGDFDVVIDLAAKTIMATGAFPARDAPQKLTRSVLAHLNANQSIFSHAIFARGTIQLSNSAKIDSYNSSTDLLYTTPLPNGAVGTNATGGAIVMSNNTQIYGNLSTGPNGLAQLHNSAEVIIDGTSYTRHNQATLNQNISHDNNRDLPSVEIPESLANLSASPAVSLWGNPPNPASAKTFVSGNYKLPFISLSNSSKLTIDGDVTLYVTGNTVLSNSSAVEITPGSSLTLYIDGVLALSNSTVINNVAKVPSKFSVFSRYSQPQGFQISNSANLYGTIYAPDTEVNLSNSIHIFGAMITKTLHLSNSTRLHYDEALGNTSGNSQDGYFLTKWQEI